MCSASDTSACTEVSCISCRFCLKIPFSNEKRFRPNREHFYATATTIQRSVYDVTIIFIELCSALSCCTFDSNFSPSLFLIRFFCSLQFALHVIVYERDYVKTHSQRSGLYLLDFHLCIFFFLFVVGWLVAGVVYNWCILCLVFGVKIKHC